MQTNALRRGVSSRPTITAPDAIHGIRGRAPHSIVLLRSNFELILAALGGSSSFKNDVMARFSNNWPQKPAFFPELSLKKQNQTSCIELEAEVNQCRSRRLGGLRGNNYLNTFCRTGRPSERVSRTKGVAKGTPKIATAAPLEAPEAPGEKASSLR